jgi:hypothetical protein
MNSSATTDALHLHSPYKKRETMKKLLIGTALAAISALNLVPIATAEKLASVVTSDFDGRTYQIDLDDRKEYTNKSGWRHVIFKISSDQDRNWHWAIASCSPYQVYVTAYNWGWETGMTNLSANTVGGKLARAACNW